MLGQQLQHADELPRAGQRAVPLLQRGAKSAKHAGSFQSRNTGA